MAPQIEQLVGFARASPLLFTAATFLLLLSMVHFLLTRPKKSNLQVVGHSKDSDYKEALMEGLSKYPEQPFIVPSAKPLVILPMCVLNEVKSLPENTLSFQKDIQRLFFTKHTGVGKDGVAVARVVKLDLTRHIASTLDGLQDEIRYGFDKEIGQCDQWTAHQLYPKLARIVALLSGRVFVGRPLSREEEWIEATIMYTIKVMQARAAISSWESYPFFVLDFMAPRLPEVKQLLEFRNRGAELMKPLLEAQLAKQGDEKLHRDEDGFNDEQGTFISWMLSHMDESKRRDPLELANNQMGLSFAAIHTTTMATTGAIFDLCAYPEYVPALRQEIEQVIAEDGYDVGASGDKKLKKSSMPKLWKLDSFLKESQRFSPPGLVANLRVSVVPLKLSTGHTIPANTRLAFPSYSVHHSATTPSFNNSNLPADTPKHLIPKQVEEFDALRFWKLRSIPGNENRYQFVTTGAESLTFGHGAHACPGRFFAGNEIKVVLIELLRNWEFRLKGDVKQEGGKEKRPKNTWREFECIPDAAAEVEFRRRKH